jgi:hypothetical protein
MTLVERAERDTITASRSQEQLIITMPSIGTHTPNLAARANL